jgi:hypothetical protein
MRLPALGLFLLFALPASAIELPAIHPSADRIAAQVHAMPALKDKGIVERAARGLPGYREIVIGDDDGKLTAHLLTRDGALIGVRFDVPLLPKADPGLFAFTELAAALEPAMAGLELKEGVPRRDAMAGWASEIGVESWMRPRFGAYRIERRVGDTLFVFEGEPLRSFWLAMSHAGGRHPVLDHYRPHLSDAEMKAAEPALLAVERGEYAKARRLAGPLAEAGAAWAMLVMADYGEPVGPGRTVSVEINRLLEKAADAGFAPAQHILGQPDSNFAERRLKQAAAAGYTPAIALKARRRYTSGRADDPAARCDELAALQGDAMAQLRTVYRYAEGGGDLDTAYFWGRVTLETFGEASSVTIDGYILHTLDVLLRDLPADARDRLDADAAAWRPKSFAELEPRYRELGCLE